MMGELRQKPAAPSDLDASGDELVASLYNYDVPFLMLDETPSAMRSLSPEQLIAALMNSCESRLRLALIPLLLRHPEMASVVREVASTLPESSLLTLKFFYTAARLLQAKLRPKLTVFFGEQPQLPDLYSLIPEAPEPDNIDSYLRHLGRLHQERSGRMLNWSGTYEHAAHQFLTRLEREVDWGIR